MKAGETRLRWYLFENEEEYLEFIHFIGNCLDLWDLADDKPLETDMRELIKEIGRYADKFNRMDKT